MAWREGIFAEEGIDPELTSLQTTLIISGLLAGEIDYGTSFSSIVHAAGRSGDLCDRGSAAALVCRAPGDHERGAAYREADRRDVAARRRGVPGAASARPLRPDARRHHPGDASRLQAMVAGALDAAVLTMPFDLQGEQEWLKVLVRLADIMELTHAGVGTTTARLRDAPDEVKRFVKSSLCGIDLIKRDKAVAVRHLSEWLSMPPDLASRAYDAAMATW
jgi:ABC-type nitrate/sulfonate/bicarbonate transport system substrate-binding protein